jgi:hypothetical protein
VDKIKILLFKIFILPLLKSAAWSGSNTRQSPAGAEFSTFLVKANQVFM